MHPVSLGGQPEAHDLKAPSLDHPAHLALAHAQALGHFGVSQKGQLGGHSFHSPLAII